MPSKRKARRTCQHYCTWLGPLAGGSQEGVASNAPTATDQTRYNGVIPAQAEIYSSVSAQVKEWIPACAGMTPWESSDSAQR